ncbi:MAG TPA: helix-turn-helix domain-containing protein [Vulgatibacter sp.]
MSAAEKVDPVLAELRAIRLELQAMREQAAPTTRALLSRQDAARLLGIDRHRLGRLAKAGLIRMTDDGGRMKIAREEVERLARDGIPREPRKVGRPRKPLRNVGAEIRAVPLPAHRAKP